MGLCALVLYLRETVDGKVVCGSEMAMMMLVVEGHDVIVNSQQE